MRMLHIATALLLTGLLSLPARAAVYVTVIQGLGGVPEYDEEFSEQSESIVEASRSLTGDDMIVRLHGEDARRENLLAHFAGLSESMSPDDRAIIYLIGHGSYDGEQYKFNIAGPDITGDDLGNILADLPGSNHFLLNTSSTSGAILEPLSGGERIIATATRSGNEKNATEFGVYFAEALTSEDADINKNNNISVREAFDYAARNVETFFEEAGRLATEHPQLQGDGAETLTLARVNPVAESDDPRIARLQQRQQEVNRRIEDLQLRRDELSNQEYVQQLQSLVIEAATINEQLDELMNENGNGQNEQTQ